MRSYKLFFAAETEDILIRHRKEAAFTPVEVRDRRIMRCSEWMDKRIDALGLLVGLDGKKDDETKADIPEKVDSVNETPLEKAVGEEIETKEQDAADKAMGTPQVREDVEMKD